MCAQIVDRFTVPVLFDKKEGVIVNNESSEILRIFNSQFNHLARARYPPQCLLVGPLTLRSVTHMNGTCRRSL